MIRASDELHLYFTSLVSVCVLHLTTACVPSMTTASLSLAKYSWLLLFYLQPYRRHQLPNGMNNLTHLWIFSSRHFGDNELPFLVDTSAHVSIKSKRNRAQYCTLHYPRRDVQMQFLIAICGWNCSPSHVLHVSSPRDVRNPSADGSEICSQHAPQPFLTPHPAGQLSSAQLSTMLAKHTKCARWPHGMKSRQPVVGIPPPERVDISHELRHGLDILTCNTIDSGWGS